MLNFQQQVVAPVQQLLGLYSWKDAEKIVNASFEGKVAPKPIFYVKYGPPASGKGGIMEKVLQKDGVRQSSVVTVEVDSVVEANSRYRESRDTTTDKTKLYFEYRTEADAIADQILDRALLQRFNIAWETTGKTVAWTVREIQRIKKMGYCVTIVYPLVPPDMLVSRSMVREQQTGQTPASPTEIKSNVTKSIQNIFKLLSFIDCLYIYDNSGRIGDESIVVELQNTWEWTPENVSNPGLKRKITCNCSKLNGMSKAFGEEFVRMLKILCSSS